MGFLDEVKVPGSSGGEGFLNNVKLPPAGYVPPTPQATPVAEPVRKKRGFGQRVANAINTPDNRGIELGTNVRKNTLKYLPSSIIQNLPFGIGQVFKQIQDEEQYNPETFNYLSLRDGGKQLPKIVADVGKGFIKAPISGAVNLAGKPVAFNIPGLGEITNAQMRTARRVAQGEDPVQVTIEEGSIAILDTLFFLSLASKPFQARQQVTTRADVDARLFEKTPGAVQQAGPKSFRPYAPKVSGKVLPPEFIQKLQQQGISLGPNFVSTRPTFFRTTLKPNGMFRFEVVQLKPSIFNSFMSKFKGKIENVPDGSLTPLYTKELSSETITKSTGAYLQNNPPRVPTAPTAPVNTGLPQELQTLRESIKIKKDIINELPGKAIEKFTRGGGSLEEIIKNKNTSFSQRRGDTIVGEMTGIEGLDLARADQYIAEYRNARKELNEQVAYLTDQIKKFKSGEYTPDVQRQQQEPTVDTGGIEFSVKRDENKVAKLSKSIEKASETPKLKEDVPVGDLAIEAKKYKSAEEFVKAINGGEKGIGIGKYGKSGLDPTEIGSWSIKDIAGGKSPLQKNVSINELKLSNQQPDIFVSFKESGATGNVNDGYTVYRVTPKGGSINAGDFVFSNEKSAKAFLEDYGYKRGQNEIQKIDGVKLDELLLPKTEKEFYRTHNSSMEFPVDELIYAPKNIQNIGIKTKSQLTDIWNKANKKTTGPTIDASLREDIGTKIYTPKSPQEFVKRIEQLNKFAQGRAILRRTGGLSKKNAGVFVGGGKRGEVRLQNSEVASPSNYMSTLAHELGHALEYNFTGKTNVNTYRVFGKDLPVDDLKAIDMELRAVTNDMVGEAKARSKPQYYYKKTELLARFLERLFEAPERVKELAPTSLSYFEKSAIESPIISEYLDAVYNNIDKGQLKFVFLRDMKQTYQKLLGNRVGERAWNNEVVYRAMKERGKIAIEKLIKNKFKNIKDAPEQLFRAVESIKVTKGGVPEFGTRDFQYAKNDKEVDNLIANGYDVIKDENKKIIFEIIDGVKYVRLAKQRYSPEEARALYDGLSPEGKKLVNEFTAQIDEAKDLFNREVIKDVYKINSNLEGWVHHYFEEGRPGSSIGSSLRFKVKTAGGRMKRTGTEGYVEDFQKAMQKALTDLETEKNWNEFIERQFAMVTKPIADGAKPDDGFIEVQGNIKRGVGTRGETKMVVVQDGKSFVPKQTRYQMPTAIYKRYQLLSEVSVEASKAVRVINSLNRYWRVNILFHPGSTATNLISGGIQYASKVLTDFYTELLTGNVSFKKTRRDIYSMLTVLTPKGWQNAPDWAYGGDLSNFYGQFSTQKAPGILDKGIDAYADKALAFYGKVERYWKKVLVTAENMDDLTKFENAGVDGLKLPTDLERELIADINSEVDLFAYDYDNVAVWLEQFNRNPVATAFKPFLKYPYKYTKHWNNMLFSIFDRTQPFKERLAKLLAITTMVAIYAEIRSRRKKKQKTPEVPETAPSSTSTRGRLFVATDEQGNELFTRVAKYPFVNLTEIGMQFIEKNNTQGFQGISDMVGSIGPTGKLALLALGIRNEFEQYIKPEVLIADNIATYIPGSRILSDLGRYWDPYARTRQNALQSFTSLIPTPIGNDDLRTKLRGEARTIKVPLEGSINPQVGEGTKRTTTDMFVRNYQRDILLGLLAGIYITRINPAVAESFIIRKKINEEKKNGK